MYLKGLLRILRSDVIADDCGMNKAPRLIRARRLGGGGRLLLLQEVDDLVAVLALVLAAGDVDRK